MCKFTAAQRCKIYAEALNNLSTEDPYYHMCAVIENAAKQKSTPDYICAVEFDEFGLFKSERDSFDWGDDMTEFPSRTEKLRVKELILMFCIEMAKNPIKDNQMSKEEILKKQGEPIKTSSECNGLWHTQSVYNAMDEHAKNKVAKVMEENNDLTRRIEELNILGAFSVNEQKKHLKRIEELESNIQSICESKINSEKRMMEQINRLNNKVQKAYSQVDEAKDSCVHWISVNEKLNKELEQFKSNK